MPSATTARSERTRTTPCDLLVTVGPLAAVMAPDFRGEHHHAADAEAAARLVPTLLRPGDVLLVKASNGVGLKLVCDTLTAVTTA